MFLLGLRFFLCPLRCFLSLVQRVERTEAVEHLTVALCRLGRLKELRNRIL